MTHKRKDTLVAIKKAGRWNKHLKPLGKRLQNQSERREAKQEIQRQAEERYRQRANAAWVEGITDYP